MTSNKIFTQKYISADHKNPQFGLLIENTDYAVWISRTFYIKQLTIHSIESVKITRHYLTCKIIDSINLNFRNTDSDASGFGVEGGA